MVTPAKVVNFSIAQKWKMISLRLVEMIFLRSVYYNLGHYNQRSP